MPSNAARSGRSKEGKKEEEEEEEEEKTRGRVYFSGGPVSISRSASREQHSATTMRHSQPYVGDWQII